MRLRAKTHTTTHYITNEVLSISGIKELTVSWAIIMVFCALSHLVRISIAMDEVQESSIYNSYQAFPLI